MPRNTDLSMCCGNTALFSAPEAAETCRDVGIALAPLPLAGHQGLGMTQTPMWLVLRWDEELIQCCIPSPRSSFPSPSLSVSPRVPLVAKVL